MTERTKGGRWAKGQSGNPGGRSGQTQTIRAKLANGADAVAKKVLEAAEGGDMQACRLVMERLIPALKPTSDPVRFELDESDLPAAAKSILRAVAAGELPPDQGKALIDALASVSRVIEVAELQKALEELSAKVEEMER